jgi:hypothetical protein
MKPLIQEAKDYWKKRNVVFHSWRLEQPLEKLPDRDSHAYFRNICCCSSDDRTCLETDSMTAS